ncbi:MAG TPA: carbamoyltransferase HypF [Dermatophilaceae bacterium]|nr:carbamoyltransferase HypF [Dermatophilaceae bacterium]
MPDEPAAGVTAVRRVVEATGVVQGVGMRPFLARLARELHLSGWCANTSSRVQVEVEGPSAAVAEFERRVVEEAPPLAVLATVTSRTVTTRGGSGFVVVDSTPDAGARTLVAPDTAPCPDCLREFADPGDRRHRHPFVTCTNCGPRFTITLDLPYDRPNTTMAGFPMCPRCTAEYADPRDRRFHAQPIGCHDCGPRLTLRGADGTPLATALDDVVAGAVDLLAAGRVVAVKGLGGYHLACAAGNPEAVARLRERKHRPHQPFAVMVRDLAAAERLVDLTSGARALLTCPARPIVLLRRRADGADRAAPVTNLPIGSFVTPDPVTNLPIGSFVTVDGAVAPGLDDLGLLLPYTPAHHLLFEEAPYSAIVMTSGNRSGEPLCVDDDDALRRLPGIADVFLTHDRPIAVPCEDSVMALDAEDRPLPVRRSRGYAPLPIPLPTVPTVPTVPVPPEPIPGPEPPPPVVLAAGAELKNTFTLVRDGLAFVSAHVGDLGTLEAHTAYERAVAQAERFHRAAPTLVVADRHPGYRSRADAARRAEDLGVPLLEVQHHHAHLAALAAEHQHLDAPLVGLVLDGTGYGCDATVWGGELLALRDGGRTAARLGHLGVLPLPGGDAGVRHPVRMAAAAMLASGLGLEPGAPVPDELTEHERRQVPRLLEGCSGWVATSSAGRLFDVAASMLGVRHRVTYEAQAAVELEALATRWARRVGTAGAARAAGAAVPLPTVAPDGGVLDPRPWVRALDAGVRAGAHRGELAWAFHAALADGAAELAAGGATAEGADVVGLTGGVFQNRLLTALVRNALAARGLRVLTHRVVPPNDGGLSLGQAAVGLASLAHPGGMP